MAATIRVEIVSAEEEIWSGDATMIVAPSDGGEIGIMPRHAPLLARLLPGDIRIQTENGDEELIYVSGGMIEVQPYVVTVLSDSAIRGDELDENAAEEAQKRAEQALKDGGAEIDFNQARVELAQAAAQLRAIQRLKKSGK